MSARRRPSRRTVRRAAGTTVALGVLGLFGQLLGLIGTVGAAGLTAAGGATVAFIEYRRDLAVVKRTGKPVDRTPEQHWKADHCRGCGAKIRIPVGQRAGVSRCSNCPDPPRRSRAQKPTQQLQSAGSGKAPPAPLFTGQPEPAQPKPIRRPTSKPVHIHADGTPCTAKTEKTCRKGGARTTTMKRKTS
jgi:hypothetical protein